eukprot:CAMPEP_0113505150 /NCGR_PEP_ID=MMETSP0014_2-20120614/35145_1 /TAXON_ID=2857 /ORGANISM="Nitzschia sp." /LENGTH=791 /DNA_ID=CAMNT_0000400407 /DNA_START=55 /DNA_END=2430 /DNA_ORIENTATION=- /assembly_acc=CAM_ASM_000159
MIAMATTNTKRKNNDGALVAATTDDNDNDGGPKLSKRQKQKQLAKNDKNKWLIQHPKIQNMDVRERVQIKDAGLKVTKAEQQQPQKKQQQKNGKTTSASNVVVDPALDMINSPEVKFGRLLGGTDQRQRHAAVRKLKLWLKARCDPSNTTGGISEIDLLKLWKALWFTLYMADKVPVQDELSKQLVSLLWCVAGTAEEDAFAAEQYILMEEGDSVDDDEAEAEEEYFDGGEGNEQDGDEDDEEDPEVLLEEIANTLQDVDSDDDDDKENYDDIPAEEIPHCRGVHLVSLFVRTFFKTIRRDWHKMDKYRIDKFYTLIRYMVHEIYSYLKERLWHFGMIRMFNDVLFEEVLRETPNGLRYHLVDVSLEELAKVAATAKESTGEDEDGDEASMSPPFTTDVFIDIMEPFLAMSQTGAKDDTVQRRVMERVFERFLEEYSIVSEIALQQKQQEEETTKNGQGSNKKKKKGDKKANDGKESESKPIFYHVSVTKISEFIFGLGSDAETNDRYRQSLYDMYKKYARRLKQVGDGVDVVDEADDDEDYYIDDDDDDVRDDTIEYSTPPKSKKSLSKDTNDSDDDAVDGEGGFESPKGGVLTDETEEDEDGSGKKKKKKRKKNERKSSDCECCDGARGEDNNECTAGADATKSSNSSKKRKIDAADDGDKDDEDEQEEVVLISLSEQRKADKQQKKKKKSKKEKSGADSTPSSSNNNVAETSAENRRVKWDKSNKAISHKASMKALKTATPPPTKERTPDKSILRKRDRTLGHDGTPQPKSSARNKKNTRKKASDYWT